MRRKMSDNFSKYLFGTPPLEEAAEFFIGLKHAHWKNPLPELTVEEKIAVSNKWIAEHAVKGLNARAAKAGRTLGYEAKDNAKHVERALGDAGSKSEVVNKLRTGTGLTQSVNKKPAAPPLKTEAKMPNSAKAGVAASGVAGVG